MLVFAYGAVVYAAFLVTFLYAIGFSDGLLVPKTIDSGVAGPVGQAVLINVLLLSLFAVQHTIMARPAFKRWFTRLIPAAAERSTFVLATCICLGLMFWQWRPIQGDLWRVDHPFARALLYALSLGGFGIVLYSSFLINHFDLFGLRQVVLHLRRIEYTHVPFKTTWLYRTVRNPLMLGFLIAFWATPDMTYGHLLFAAVTTGYIFFGVHVEERDLARHLGDEYRDYRQRTPLLLPWPRRQAAHAADDAAPMG
jgi:protein-S-isoprenylcysteine O-methyltransferase Ste14